jgi:type IV secretion system protein VirD4
MKENMEKEEFIKVIGDAYARRWIHPSNSLLVGTVTGHPLDDTGIEIPTDLEDESERHVCELPIWFAGPEMGVTIGASGSGKFTGAIAPNLILHDGSCLVIDPKGEACAVTATARKNMHGQNVYRLDPFEETVFDPMGYQPPLSSYNPLDMLDPDDARFPDDVESLVEALMPARQRAGDQFWDASAKELLKALIMFVCTHGDAEGDRTLYKVYEYLSADGTQKEWLFEQMALSSFDAIRLAGNTHGAMPEKMREGIWQHARMELAIFSSPAIKRVTSSSSFRLEDLFEGGCTLYIVLPAEYLESHNRWVRLMMTISLMVATRYKNNKRMLWMVDEAAQLGRHDIITLAYRLQRGHGVRIWTFWQNLQDIKATYPDNWMAIFANSFVQLMSCGDGDTARYFGDEQLFSMKSDEMFLRLPGEQSRLVHKPAYYANEHLKESAAPNPYYQDWNDESAAA